jgi:WhiB family redox-sensing transcriptional regulator
MAVVTAEGITWELARVWIGDRYQERKFKRNGASQRCPLCWLERRVIPMYEKDWRHRAACRDVEDPEIFFPIDTMWSQPGNEDNIAMAKAVCRECPVSAECLEWAIESGEAWAVAGGMLPAERRKLVRQAA